VQSGKHLKRDQENPLLLIKDQISIQVEEASLLASSALMGAKPLGIASA
jgi:hypothetical protein